MRVTRAILFGATAITAAIGCHPTGDSPNNAPVAQVAYTRFVNAVNDTGALDMRFVDQVQNSPVGLAVQYRSFTFYQATNPGNRLLRAFFDSVNTAQAVTVSTVQVGNDTTLSLTAGSYYTIVLLGPSKSAKPKWIVLTDNSGTANKGFDTTWSSVVADTLHIAARIVNLTAADGAGETVSPFMAKDTLFLTNNVAFPVAAAAPVATGALAYTAITKASFDTSIVKFAEVTGTTAAGTLSGKTFSYYSAVPVGVPASKIDNLTAIGGLIQGGTAMSIYVFAPVGLGSAAPCSGTVTAGAAPGCSKTLTAQMRNYGVVFVVDHHPSPNF